MLLCFWSPVVNCWISLSLSWASSVRKWTILFILRANHYLYGCGYWNPIASFSYVLSSTLHQMAVHSLIDHPLNGYIQSCTQYAIYLHPLLWNWVPIELLNHKWSCRSWSLTVISYYLLLSSSSSCFVSLLVIIYAIVTREIHWCIFLFFNFF